jgi:hypothetical protein
MGRKGKRLPFSILRHYPSLSFLFPVGWQGGGSAGQTEPQSFALPRFAFFRYHLHAFSHEIRCIQ